MNALFYGFLAVFLQESTEVARDPNFDWLFYGFLAAWLVHLGYLLSITMRQSSIRREMESLRRMIEERTRG